MKLRHDKLGAERLRDGGERRGRRRSELHVRDFLRESLHRDCPVAFRELGRLGREGSKDLEHLRENLENFVVKAGEEGERADGIARGGARVLVRHRVDRRRHGCDALDPLFPVARLQLRDDVRGVQTRRSLDQLLLRRRRALGDVGVSLGVGPDAAGRRAGRRRDGPLGRGGARPGERTGGPASRRRGFGGCERRGGYARDVGVARLKRRRTRRPSPRGSPRLCAHLLDLRLLGVVELVDGPGHGLVPPAGSSQPRDGFNRGGSDVRVSRVDAFEHPGEERPLRVRRRGGVGFHLTRRGGDPQQGLLRHLGHLVGERGEDIVGDVRQREAVLGKFEKRVLVLLHHGRVLILEFVEHAGQQYLCLPGPFLAEALGERPGRRARLAHARDVGILGDDFLERPGDVAVVAGCEPRRVRELLQPRHGVQAFLPLGGVHRVPELRGLLVLRLLLELVEDGLRVGKLVRVGESRGGVRRDHHRAVAAVYVHGVDASRVRRRVGTLLAREPLTNRAANLDGFRGGLHLRLHGAPHLLDQIPAHGIVAEPPGELHGEILRRAANLGVLGVEQGRDSLEDRLGRHHRGRPEFLHGDAHGLDARERELGNLVRGSLQQRVHHCIAALQLQQQHARLRGAIHRLGPSAHALRDDVCEDARRVRPGVVLVRDGEERVESIEAEVKRVGVGISGGVLSAFACGSGSGEGLRVRDLRC